MVRVFSHGCPSFAAPTVSRTAGRADPARQQIRGRRQTGIGRHEFVEVGTDRPLTGRGFQQHRRCLVRQQPHWCGAGRGVDRDQRVEMIDVGDENTNAQASEIGTTSARSSAAAGSTSCAERPPRRRR